MPCNAVKCNFRHGPHSLRSRTEAGELNLYQTYDVGPKTQGVQRGLVTKDVRDLPHAGMERDFLNNPELDIPETRS